jgi:hypothetical protein
VWACVPVLGPVSCTPVRPEPVEGCERFLLPPQYRQNGGQGGGAFEGKIACEFCAAYFWPLFDKK